MAVEARTWKDIRQNGERLRGACSWSRLAAIQQYSIGMHSRVVNEREGISTSPPSRSGPPEYGATSLTHIARPCCSTSSNILGVKTPGKLSRSSHALQVLKTGIVWLSIRVQRAGISLSLSLTIEREWGGSSRKVVDQPLFSLSSNCSLPGEAAAAHAELVVSAVTTGGFAMHHVVLDNVLSLLVRWITADIGAVVVERRIVLPLRPFERLVAGETLRIRTCVCCRFRKKTTRSPFRKTCTRGLAKHVW